MTKESKIPDEQFEPRNLDEHPHVMLEGYRIAEWSPERDGKGKPSQAHLLMDLPGLGATFAIRFKSADAIDRHIAILMRHRNNVFGSGESA